MTRASRWMVAASLFVGVLLPAVGSEARPKPLMFRTAAIVPDPNGHFMCLVRADSASQIDVEARIVGPTGANMVEYGSTFVVSPIGSDDHRYHVEQDAGSTTDETCFCEVSVRGARRSDLRIDVTLESRDATGALVQTTQVP
jgi:hypothetical protein